MNYIQIGALTLPVEWIALLGSVFLASFVFKIYFKTSLDWMFTALFLLIFIWKVSFLFVEWDMNNKSMYSLLYFNGGALGYIIGALGISVYLYVKKNMMPQAQFLLILYLALMTFYELILFGFNPDAMIDFAQILINLSWLVYSIKNIKSLSKQTVYKAFILFALWNILIYSLKDEMISLNTFSHIWMIITLLMVSSKEEKA